MINLDKGIGEWRSSFDYLFAIRAFEQGSFMTNRDMLRVGINIT